MISPKICHCIHPFFREYAPVSTPSSYCIRYSVIKRYSVIVLYKMHIVHWGGFRLAEKYGIGGVFSIAVGLLPVQELR